MKPLQQLLAATDLSASALHAVDRGFQIAARTGAGYTVLHALGIDALAELRSLFGGDTTAILRRIEDEARAALAMQLDHPARSHGVRPNLRLVPGLAAAALPQVAQECGADLILLGAHGQGFLQRFLLGSTASRVLRRTRCPVLVVKEPCRAPYRRALVAVDFSAISPAVLREAHRVAPEAELVLLHAFDLPFEGKLQIAGVREEDIMRYRMEAHDRALRRLHELAAAEGLASPGVRVSRGDAARQVLMQEEIQDCDLVVVGKHGANVTEELLLGSVTHHVLAESRSDVLVVAEGPHAAAPPAHTS